MDPRVVRTQSHVLEQARRLLAERGPAGVNFSVLAQEARVSRQTLYRYWEGPEALVADLITRRVTMPPETVDDVRSALVTFLRGLRTVLQDPACSVAYGMLITSSHHSRVAAEALTATIQDRLDMLNTWVADLHAPFTPDDFSRLAGPLVHAHFFGRRRIEDRLIDDVVGAFDVVD